METQGRTKMIKMLDSISKFDTYSRYSTSLDKRFKCNSLKNLINTLKTPQLTKEEIANEELTKLLGKKNSPYEINPFKYDKRSRNNFSQNQFNIFDKNYSPEEKPSIRLNSPYKRYNFFRRRIRGFSNIVMDPFKYNPNYNSIYKNIPTVKLSTLSKDTRYNLYKFNNVENHNGVFLTDVLIPEKNKNLSSNLLKYNNTNYFSQKFSKNQKSLNTSQNSSSNSLDPTINSSKKKTMDVDKNNHALRFSKYTSRKIKNYEGNDIISYINPYNYLSGKNNKAIDFNKMRERSWTDLINLNTINNPAVCHYNPRYEFLETKPKNVYFNPSLELNKLRKNKKFLLHKILSSYYITEEYKIIDNNKLKPLKTENSLEY